MHTEREKNDNALMRYGPGFFTFTDAPNESAPFAIRREEIELLPS